ncbi:MAG: hypothetical protein ACLQVK_22845 [Acidimicrobiales bacterium]
MTIDLSTFPAATATVECQWQSHTIRWEAGDLVASDHDDPEGERALAALGGTDIACINVLNAWQRHRCDPRLLTVCTRGPGDPVQPWPSGQGPPVGRGVTSGPLTTLTRGPTAGSPRQLQVGRRLAQGWSTFGGGGGFSASAFGGGRTLSATATARSGRPGVPGIRTDEEDRLAGLEILAGLGSQLPVRLVATVTAHLLIDLAAGAEGSASVLPTLHASLFGRAYNALANWLEGPAIVANVETAEPGSPVVVERAPGGGEVHALFPLGWVAEVWGRGLTVVAGRLVLGVLEATPERTVLETLGPDWGPPRVVVIELR